MAFSYDLDTNIGKVRLLINDSDRTDPLFSDKEIQVFLDLTSQTPELAAARAYGTIIRAKSLLAKVVKREGYQTEEFAISELRSLVNDMINEYERSQGVQSSQFALDDSHFETSRPEWRDMGDSIVQ